MLGGEFYSSTSTEDYWRAGAYENSISNLLVGVDHYDYYKSDGFVFYGILKPFQAVELSVTYNNEQYSSLKAINDFSVFSKYSSYRINPAIDPNFDQIDQESITLGITLNPDEINNFAPLSTTFSVKAELVNNSAFSNDFRYNKYQAELKSNLRLDRSTLIKWRLMAGGITGEAPAFKNFALGGVGSLRAMGYKAISGNQMLLSNLELQFGKSSSHKKGWPDLSSTTL